jgi:hypothetical protein
MQAFHYFLNILGSKNEQYCIRWQVHNPYIRLRQASHNGVQNLDSGGLPSDLPRPEKRCLPEHP